MNPRLSPRFALASLALSAAAAWWGCDAAPMNTFTSSSSSTSSGNGGGGAGGGTTSSTTSSTSSGEGGGINLDGGMNDGNEMLDDASVCSGTEAQASLIPLDMIVLLDRSGSMSGTKWDTVTVALEAFFQDPASAGIGAGLVYFPNDMADDCVYSDYANLDVPIGTLPGNASALVTSIDNNGPTGATPTYGALKGALFAATSYQDAHPNHKVILVIATDGDPTECSITDSTQIANLASAAYNYNGVQTYAIAVPGSTLSNLDKIAAAGGTTKAYDVTNDIMQFSAKMAEIRSSALSCELAIPPPPMGETLDPAKVNVVYTPGNMTAPKTLPNVLSQAQCGTKSAWYYDNNTTPTKIILCPAACQKVQADSTANISVKFGCKTIAM
jgi:Mg-chelatase subunit ChlD